MTRTVWSTRLPAIALAQIDTFVKNPMTLQLGLRGLASLLDFANVIHGLRIMGDSASGNNHSGD